MELALRSALPALEGMVFATCRGVLLFDDCVRDFAVA